MRDDMDRTIFAVIEDGEGWCVESSGTILDRRDEKDEAKAAAHRRARTMQDSGKPCMVRVSGEHGFVTRSTRDLARQGPAERPAARKR